MINLKKWGIARHSSPATFIILFLVIPLQLRSYSAHAETMIIAPNCDKFSLIEMMKDIKAINEQKAHKPEVNVTEIVQQHILGDCDVVTLIAGLANAEFKLTVSNERPNKVFATLILENWWIASRSFHITIEYSSGRVKSVSGYLSTNSL